MPLPWNILARGEDRIGELLQIIFAIVVAVIMVIASVLKKAMDARRAQEREAQRHNREPGIQASPERRAAEAARRATEAAELLVLQPAEAPPQVRMRPRRPKPPPPAPPPRPEPLAPAMAAAKDDGAKVARPMAARAAEASAAARLLLTEPDALRRAILCHEILSPPKALRGQAEMWDL